MSHRRLVACLLGMMLLILPFMMLPHQALADDVYAAPWTLAFPDVPDARGHFYAASDVANAHEMRGLSVSWLGDSRWRASVDKGVWGRRDAGVEFRFVCASDGSTHELRGWSPGPSCVFDVPALIGAASELELIVEARDASGSLGWATYTLGKKELREMYVREILAGMSTEEKVAQLCVPTLERLTGSPTYVTEPSDELREAMERHCVGGICIMGGNLVDPEQAKRLLSALTTYSQDASGLVPLLAVDEEGGTVTRVAGDPNFGVYDPGNMSELGATGDTELARAEAKRVGTYLRDLGFNVNFAPVADISSGYGCFIQWRSFGTDADLVSSMVAAQVRGFGDAGILCAAKHFPGIGAAEGDSHYEGIYSFASEQEMRDKELKPFASAIDAGVPIIMVGHLSCINIDGGEMPASLSRAVVTGLLRDGLGYDGLIITDSLGMAAVMQVVEPREAGVRALLAGCDLLLMSPDFEACYQGVLDAVNSGRISEERLDESVARVLRAKLSLM